MKQINSFMSEIPDDFKVVVVDAIKALCIKVGLQFNHRADGIDCSGDRNQCITRFAYILYL
jgi:hypothetical protein